MLSLNHSTNFHHYPVLDDNTLAAGGLQTNVTPLADDAVASDRYWAVSCGEFGSGVDDGLRADLYVVSAGDRGIVCYDERG